MNNSGNNNNNLGIVLAAGRSSRLYPATLAATKQLLPIYDKPLIYYPLSVLMLGGIRNIATITSPAERNQFIDLYTKSAFHRIINPTYYVQEKPTGLPDAFVLTKDCIGRYDKVVMILGDNIFHGSGLTGILNQVFNAKDDNAYCFGVKTPDMMRFGVAVVDSDVKIGRGNVKTLMEKPTVIEEPKRSFVITGLYVFPNDVFDKASTLKPSQRGETEITDLLRLYQIEDRLRLEVLPRGITWFDTGTPSAMLDASQYVKVIQSFQGSLVCSPHEIAWRNGWTTAANSYIEFDTKSDYANKLREIMEE